MKTRILTFFSLVIIAGTLTIWSCKKDDEKVATKQDASSIAKKDAVSNSAYNDVYSESEEIISYLEKNKYPASNSNKSASLIGSKVIVVTNHGDTTTFPKVITVVYTNYTSYNGIKKNGKITITQNATMRKSGAVRSITFEDFIVNDTVKLEGKVTITNQGLVSSKPSIKVQLSDGKITFMNSGFYLTREFIRTITWESGFDLSSILNIWDDVYTFSETAKGSTSDGFNYSSRTSVPLEYKVGELCIKKGKIDLSIGGVKAYLDFTRATCSEKIKLTIEGDLETF